MLDRNKLRAKLIEHGLSNEKLADILGVNPATVYRKINGSSDFSRNEIQIIKLELRLSAEETEAIFFASKLTETQVS